MYDTDDQRLKDVNKCAPLSNNIVVNQVIGERSEQEAYDIHICIPRHKPSAEQIINVFVKKLRITHVDIITNKVIVRGHFEVKVIYVGCMPCQPVHAVEIRGVRFTIDLPIRGARRGMEADASAIVEFIDYDDVCDNKIRDDRYKNKYGHIKKQHINCGYDHDDCHDDCHEDHGHHHHDDCHDECHEDHGHHYKDDCHDDCHKDYGHHYKDDCHDDCHEDHGHHHYDDCHDDCHKDYGHHHHDDWHDDCHHDHGHHHQSCCCSPHKIKCSREFDVSVVLRVNAKVMVDREIMMNPIYPKMSPQPKVLAYPQMPVHPKG